MRLIGVDRPVLKRERMLREPADVQHGARHDAVAHPGEQHAGVVALEHAERIRPLADLLGEAVQHRLALGGAECAPRGEGALCGGDRGLDVLGQAFGNTAEQAAVDRAAHFEALGRGDASSVDVVIGGHGDTGHV